MNYFGETFNVYNHRLRSAFRVTSISFVFFFFARFVFDIYPESFIWFSRLASLNSFNWKKDDLTCLSNVMQPVLLLSSLLQLYELIYLVRISLV